MDITLWKQLPKEILTYIIEYLDNMNLVQRKNWIWVLIGKISIWDSRYALLETLPKRFYLEKNGRDCHIKFRSKLYSMTILFNERHYDYKRCFIFYKEHKKEGYQFPLLEGLHQFLY